MTTPELKNQDALELEILYFVADLVRGKKKYKGNIQKCTLNDISCQFNRRYPDANFKSKAGCSLKKFLAERCGLTKIDGNGNIEVAADQLQLLVKNAKAKQTTNETQPPQVFLNPSSSTTSIPAIKVNNVNAGIKFRPKDPTVYPEPEPAKAEQDLARERFSHLVLLMYDMGINQLRHIFKLFYPSWSNSPTDAKVFDKGKLKFEYADQKALFDTGDIDQWDLSLMTNSLLYSKVSGKILKGTDPKYNGFQDAIRGLQTIRNKFIGHRAHPLLTEDEYNQIRKDAVSHLSTLGLDKTKLDEFFKGLPFGDDYYYRMFLKEVQYENENGEQIAKMREEMQTGFDRIMNNLERQTVNLERQTVNQERQTINQERHTELLEEILENTKREKRISTTKIEEAANLDRSSWDAWIQLKQNLRDFDTISAQYILLVDKLSDFDLNHYGIFTEINWKLVLDIDPDSEQEGLMEKTNLSGNNIIVTHTPISIMDERQHLERSLDPKKTQWVYANGRNRDSYECTPKKNVTEWKREFAAQIGKFLDCLAGKLDPMKPIICVVLPARNADILQIAKVLLERINECFTSNKYNITYVSINSNSLELNSKEFPQTFFSSLPPEYLFLGIRYLLGYNVGDYLMPTPRQDIFKPIAVEIYRHITEYLDILYKDCENIPNLEECSDEELDEFKKLHLESFVGGNPISFESLAFGHDARREITTMIFGSVSRLLFGHLSKAAIVNIVHSPGSGGTTIARRVLWDLHLTYPCAIINLKEMDVKAEVEKDAFVLCLADRIKTLEDACEASPLILLDGNSSVIQSFSGQLVRKLHASGIKAVILRCLHACDKWVRLDPHVRSSFEINGKLEDSCADLDAFKNKYASLLEDRSILKGSRRVFHFPLLVMMGTFQESLQRIVVNSMESIQRTSPFEYEVAILVAFIQLYSGRATPAVLIKKVFSKQISKLAKSKGYSAEALTCHDIAGCFSDNLLNLMVQERAPTRRQWLSRQNNFPKKRMSSPYTERMIECYTFQHVAVAKLVLKSAGRTLPGITEDFLSYPIYNLRSNEGHQFKSIINQLFLYHQRDEVTGFSSLIKELEVQAPDLASNSLLRIAENTGDSSFYCHAAKYLSRKKKDFEGAKGLITQAFAIDVEASSDKKRKIHDFYGNILLSELKAEKGKIKDFETLENMAGRAINAFKKARKHPPSKPYPLLGEVKVWIECYNWIFQKHCGNIEAGLRCIMTERRFFCTSVGDSYTLLNIADKLLSTEVDLTHVEVTRRELNNNRLRLLGIFGWSENKSLASLQQSDRWQFCEKLCSSQCFKKASPEELLRLKVAYLFSYTDKDTEFSEADRKYAIKLLEELVLKHGMFKHANMLLRMSRLPNQAHFTIDKAFEIVSPWCESLKFDTQAPFYMYVLSFLKILNGDDILEYRSKYEQAVKECFHRSKNNMRQYSKQYYLGLESKENKNRLSLLITRSELERLKMKGRQLKGNPTECDKTNISVEEFTKEEDEYWLTESREYLFECSGRIRTKKERGKEQPFIELTQGGVAVYVRQNAVGKAHIDYRIGQLVYFVVSFSLAGPVANGVRFTSKPA